MKRISDRGLRIANQADRCVPLRPKGEGTDELQLTYASSEERAIFTYNVPDYLELYRNWLQNSKNHSGIIVFEEEITSRVAG